MPEELSIDSSLVIEALQDELNNVNSRLIMAVAITKKLTQQRDQALVELDELKRFSVNGSS